MLRTFWSISISKRTSLSHVPTKQMKNAFSTKTFRMSLSNLEFFHPVLRIKMKSFSVATKDSLVPFSLCSAFTGRDYSFLFSSLLFVRSISQSSGHVRVSAKRRFYFLHEKAHSIERTIQRGEMAVFRCVLHLKMNRKQTYRGRLSWWWSWWGWLGCRGTT